MLPENKLKFAMSYLNCAKSAHKSLMIASEAKDIFGASHAGYYCLFYCICALHIIDVGNVFYSFYQSDMEKFLYTYIQNGTFNGSVQADFVDMYSVNTMVTREVIKPLNWSSIYKLIERVKSDFIDVYSYVHSYCVAKCRKIGIEENKEIKVIVAQRKHNFGLSGMVAFIPQFPVERNHIYAYSTSDGHGYAEIDIESFKNDYVFNINTLTKKYNEFVKILEDRFSDYELEFDISKYLMFDDLEISWRQFEEFPTY